MSEETGPHVFTLLVEGRAVSQGSKRHIGNGVMIEQNAKLKPWRSHVRAEAVRHWGLCMKSGPWTKPVMVDVTFFFARPKYHFLHGEVRKNAPLFCVGRQDVDKLSRSILDSLAGVVYNNDNQVVVLNAVKQYAPYESALIRVALVT